MPKRLFYLLGAIATLTTLGIGFSHGLAGLALFAITPYLLSLYLVKIAQHNTARKTAKSMTLFITAVGLYFLLDSTYMERNLGDKFSFLFIPIWQWTMLMVSGFVIYLSNDKKKT